MINMREPLTKDVGRWASADLYLEYAYEAINEPKYKENCCSLWFEKKRIESAIELLKEEIEKGDGSRITMCKENIIKRIDEAFPDLNTPSNEKVREE